MKICLYLFKFIIIFLYITKGFTCEINETDQNNVRVLFEFINNPTDNPKRIKFQGLVDSYRAFEEDNLESYIKLKNKFEQIKDWDKEAEQICPGVTEYCQKSNSLWLKDSINNAQQNFLFCQQIDKYVFEANPIYFAAFLQELIVDRGRYLHLRYVCFNNQYQKNGNNFKNYSYVSTLPKHQENLGLINKYVSQNIIDRFLFLNQCIKIMYEILPKNFRMLHTELYISISPKLKIFLEDKAENFTTPDECIIDGLRYASTYEKNQILALEEGKKIQYGGDILFLNPHVKNLGKRINKDKSIPKHVDAMVQKLDQLNQLIIRSKAQTKSVATSQLKKRIQPRERQLHQIPLTFPQPDILESNEVKDNIVAPVEEQKFSLEEKFTEPDPYQTPIIREKVKKRGIPYKNMSNPDVAQNKKLKEIENNLEEKDSSIDSFIYIGGHCSTLFHNFWNSNAGFTYNDFKSLFTKLGGHIKEDTGSSHIKLTYIDSKNILYTNGTWRPHGSVSEYGLKATKYLKLFMEQCGLTPELIKTRHEKKDSFDDQKEKI